MGKKKTISPEAVPQGTQQGAEMDLFTICPEAEPQGTVASEAVASEAVTSKGTVASEGTVESKQMVASDTTAEAIKTRRLAELHISEFAQGTFDWRKERLGRFTATRIADIMSKGRGKDEVFGDTAISMMAEVAAERELNDELLTDEERFKEWSDYQCRQNAAMMFGHNYEPLARDLYEVETGNRVTEVGLVICDEADYLAVSPDGLVLDEKGNVDGMIEIKCPSTTKTFMRYKWNIKDGDTLKKENKSYYYQVMANMLVTGARWCDFIVFSPYCKSMSHIVRIERNEADIREICDRVKLANEYIEERS